MIYANNMIIKIIILLLLIWIVGICKNGIKENFVTWSPGVIDQYNQPNYSYYFYRNNYMYPYK